MSDIVPIRRALLSVSDKSGLIELASALSERSVHLLASGGTYKALVDAGIAVTEVSAHTGQPEILGGRVKTLHPKLHGGILARRDIPSDLEALTAQGIDPIDLVVVNLYPFEQTVAKPGVSFEDAVENIDIGGPSLIRGAAKNHEHVAVLTSPDQYTGFLASFRDSGGSSLAMRRSLALDVFRLTGSYDSAIAAYLGNQIAPAAPDEVFPERLSLGFRRRSSLRYGENPHQRAAFYVEPDARGAVLANANILHGKELSYNNLLDLDSAIRLVRVLDGDAAVILKHNNPCGAAEAGSMAEAFELAYEGDPLSAFGGIVGLRGRVDRATAERMIVPGRFLECIVAHGFDDDAFALLTTKPTWKNSVRLIVLPDDAAGDARSAGWDLRRIEGGLLVQDWDPIGAAEDAPEHWQVATKRGPTDAERQPLAFAWKICAAVKSNAIVLAKGTQIVGVGAGQMSRLDSTKIAVEKAGERSTGAVLASDAFFPFRDGPDVAAKAGVTAIIQPGGSRRDSETFAACDEHGMAMVLTGRRHFRH